jgi:hypothetical protein
MNCSRKSNSWDVLKNFESEVRRLETSQIITLLSGAGLGAVLSAILMFINNSKRNQLDYITRERSEWRREIKSIIVDLLSGKNRYDAVSRLETQLNPYGRYDSEEDEYKFYMNDAHIWKLVDNFDYSTKNVKILTRYLELLLKYDWERSKREVKYDIFNCFIYFILISGLLSNVFLIIFKIETWWMIIILLVSSIIMIISIFYFSEFNKNFTEKKIKFGSTYILILCLAMYYSILYFLMEWLRSYEIKEWVIIGIGFLVIVLFCSIEWNLFYRVNNMEKEYINSLKMILNKENTHV